MRTLIIFVFMIVLVGCGVDELQWHEELVFAKPEHGLTLDCKFTEKDHGLPLCDDDSKTICQVLEEKYRELLLKYLPDHPDLAYLAQQIDECAELDQRFTKAKDLNDACAYTPWAGPSSFLMTLEDYPDCRELLGFGFIHPR